MKACFRWLALVCLVFTALIWMIMGANTGWTKTSVQVQKFDPVLEMDYVEWETSFRPGIDFFAGGVALAGVLGLWSRFVGNRRKP